MSLFAGADPNHMDNKGDTPLHVAVQEQNIRCIGALLQYGSQNRTNPLNLSVFNDNGLTPFHLAVASNNKKICAHLAEKVKPSKGSIFDDIDRKKGYGVLHIAVENGADAVVEYLLEKKLVDVNKKTPSGHSALFIAHALEDGPSAITEMLLKYGAEICESLDDSKEMLKEKIARITNEGRANETLETLAKIKLEDVKVQPRPKELISNPELQRSDKPIDVNSMNRLCDIFNKDDKWKRVAEALGYQIHIQNWNRVKDPSKALLMFSEVRKVLFFPFNI